MNFPYEDLYYVKARGPDDRRPAEKWGGYNQDFEDASTVYTHEEVKMLPHNDWLTNSIKDRTHASRQLLIFDLDVYKAGEDFDGDRVGVPTNTPVVKSQSGGYHVYFAVVSPTRGQESDFEFNQRLPFDIDIRGEYVKHHVVAPNDVPGVSSGYEIVEDEPIQHVFDPGEAARQITIDGEQAIYHNPGRGGGAGNYQRDEIDPPDDMPKCYGAGLSLRAEAPDDEDLPEGVTLNTHKVNVLTALSGLAAGYSTETVVEHFIEDYYPGDPDNADKERTEYQVGHIADKLDRGDYDPPTVATLQDYGIIPPDEWCYCGLPGHDAERESQSDYYEANLTGLARIHGVGSDPHEDDRALLETCLHAREEDPTLEDAKPPYGAIRAVVDYVGLDMESEADGIIGKNSYKVAKRVFDDLEPGEVDL